MRGWRAYRRGRIGLALCFAVVATAPGGLERDLPADLASLRGLVTRARYAEAQQRGEDALTLLETRGEGDTLAAAELMDVLVEARYGAGKSVEPATEALAERSLAIKERRLGAAAPAVAVSLDLLGRLASMRDKKSLAQSLHERGLEIRRHSLGPDDPAVADSLYYLAKIRAQGAEDVAAAALQWQALEIRRRALGPDDPRVADSLHHLANLRIAAGDYREARRLHEQALHIREDALGADHPAVSTSLHNLGYLSTLEGDYGRAVEIYERMLEISTKAYGPNDHRVADGLINLAGLLDRMGDLDRAISVVQRALAIDESTFGLRHAKVSRSLESLAHLWTARGRLEQAEDAARRAVEIEEQLQGPDLARAQINLASILARQGSAAEAEWLYRLAAERVRKSFGARSANLVEPWLGLGKLAANEGSTVAARRWFQQCEAVIARELGREHPQRVEVLVELAKLDLVEHRIDAAARRALHAESIAREKLQHSARGLTEREALRYEASRTACLDIPLEILARPRPRADLVRLIWDAVIRSRAVLLDEMVERHRGLLDAPSSEVSSLRDAVAQARNRLTQLLAADSRPGRDYRQTLEAALEEEARAARALANRSSEFRARQLRREFGFDAVARALPPGSALLSFASYRPGPACLALILRAGDPHPGVVPLGPLGPIVASVRDYRAALERGDYREAGERLRRAIWDPLAPSLGTPQRVFVVPDGELSLVSFATLPAAGGGFLIEAGPRLHYLATERDLVAESPPREPGKGLLVVGGPDFEQETGARPLARGRFEALLGARDEAAELARLWQRESRDRDVRKLAGKRAAEDAFKAFAPGRRVLHLATHTFTLGSAAGALTMDGLALAGANVGAQTTSSEDGLLTADEIAELDLRGVEWVVLSACASGVGPVWNGEGVLGLRRAFRVAGAGTLIMTLGPVHDSAASEWVQDLYAARLSGLSTLDAVDRASHLLLARLRQSGADPHPYYWGGFVAVGDWR